MFVSSLVDIFIVGLLCQSEGFLLNSRISRIQCCLGVGYDSDLFWVFFFYSMYTQFMAQFGSSSTLIDRHGADIVWLLNLKSAEQGHPCTRVDVTEYEYVTLNEQVMWWCDLMSCG